MPQHYENGKRYTLTPNGTMTLKHTYRPIVDGQFKSWGARVIEVDLDSQIAKIFLKRSNLVAVRFTYPDAVSTYAVTDAAE